MQVTVDRAELLRALSLASGLCRIRSLKPPPWEKGFLLRVSSGAVEALSTSLDVAVSARVTGGSAGRSRVVEAFIVPKKTSQLVSRLSGDRATIRTLARSIRVTSGGASAVVRCDGALDFPEFIFDDEVEGASFSIDAAKLRPVFGAVLQTVCRDMSRPAFCGVLVRVRGGDAVIASTDGKRLTEVSVPVEGEAVEPFTLPEGAVAAVYRATAKAPGNSRVLFTIGAEQITIRPPGPAVVHAKPLPFPFPDYSSIVPSDFAYSFEVELAEWRRVLRTVAPYAPDEMAIAPGRVRLCNGDEGVRIEARDATGSIEVEVPAQWKGYEGHVCFDVRYLQSWAARATGGERIEVGIEGPERPCLFRVCGREDLRCVIMPML